MDALFEKIEAIQKQPVHVRKQILFVTTGVLSAIIFVVWLFLFPTTLQKGRNSSAGSASSTGPFAALLGTIREAGEGFSKVGDGFKNELEYVKENTPPTTPSIFQESGLTGSTSVATATPKQAE